MITYIITTFASSTGANLSRPGSWGNRPFTSIAAAEKGAEVDAAGEQFTITRESAKRRGRTK